MKTEDPLPPSVEEAAISLAQRQMIRPALLFLLGHRPFSFIAGQCLWLALPLTLLFPGWPLRAWADLLSRPQGGERLENCLRAYIDPFTPSARTEPRPPLVDQ